MMRGCAGGLAWLIALVPLASGRACAAGVPIDGFLPMVGITLTDEFVADIDFFPHASESLGGSPISPTGMPRYDLALLDTGAATSLLTSAADAAFDLAGPYPGEPDGFAGTEFIPIGGATGVIEARVSDPLGLYAAGLQARGSGEGLVLNPTAMLGQTNTSIVTLPPESDLPNILGLNFASQYATRIRNSEPQLFQSDGKTVRTPAIDFLPLGSGNTHGIARRAPMSIEGSSPSTPLYTFNITGIGGGEDPWENPMAPTIVQGGHFLNVNVANEGTALNAQKFFFDTGASVTVLSELTALQVGIDVQTDKPDFTIEVVGSGGGSGALPGYYIDQLTVLATGGNVTLNNVPVLVFDVTNPASPGNIVPGIVGTNVFAGRDIIIDPNPALGGGGASPSVYISDPVTTVAHFVGPESNWHLANSWSNGEAPGQLTVVNVGYAAGSNGQLLLNDATAWEVTVSGNSAAEKMELQVQGGTLTTFAGVTVEDHGLLNLFGTVDAQYVDLRGGRIRGGSGSRIVTGSGPIAGQLENTGGVLEVTGVLELDGRYANAEGGAFEVLLRGDGDDGHGQLLVEGVAALAGTLRATTAPLMGAPFDPAAGSSFAILSATEGIGGEFDLLDLPLLAGGKSWEVVYDELEVLLRVVLGGSLAGDFNGDGSVDAADLAAWRAGFGTTYDGGDFLDWQRNLGAAGGGAAAVPEPSAGLLLFIAAGTGSAALKRRRPVRCFGLVA